MMDLQKEARKVLGDKYTHLTDEEVRNIVAKFDYLANAWLDKKEREVFKGKTISELLTRSDNDK